jgi:hypothetical protein
MAAENSFPGVQVRRALSLNLFKLGSSSDKAWVAPLRRIASDTYKRVNEAVAELVLHTFLVSCAGLMLTSADLR